MHLTLREMTADLRRRATDTRLIAVWVGVSLVCVVSGPFETSDMPILARLAYWPLSILLAMILSTALVGAAYDHPRLAGLPPLLRGLIGASLFSLLYAGLLSGAGALAFGQSDGYPDYGPDYGLMLIHVAPVAWAITVIVHLFVARAAKPTAARAGPAPFLRRLKPALGRDLVRLSMQDHYVEAVTARGSQLVLMRFVDALEEVDGVAGHRIHRSHWAAEAGIADIRRENGKTLVVTADGAVLPVSRTYLHALREAGLLDRFR